jgi:hypothetical protein
MWDVEIAIAMAWENVEDENWASQFLVWIAW